MLEKFKAVPPAEKEKRIKIMKEVISFILYFVILNNPKMAGFIKIAMKIFGITEEKFNEIDGVIGSVEL
jgi:hypothetical protein